MVLLMLHVISCSMTDDKTNMVVKTEIAKPLYYQKLEKSLDIAPFLTYVEDFLKQPLG